MEQSGGLAYTRLQGRALSEEVRISTSLHALEAAALLLPPEERAKLAERLIASLDRDPEITAAWDEEIMRRIAELDAGRLESIPAEQVFSEARARLRA